MLLKLKNKILLGLDRLIEDTKKKGGVPDVVLLEPKEAAGFIRELGEFKNICKEHAAFEQKNDSDIDIRFLIQASLSKKELLKIINQWYEEEITISYRDVEIRVIKNKVPPKSDVPDRKELPPAPSVPDRRIVAEDAYKECKVCGSPLHTKFIFWDDGCMLPECENYYKK